MKSCSWYLTIKYYKSIIYLSFYQSTYWSIIYLPIYLSTYLEICIVHIIIEEWHTWKKQNKESDFYLFTVDFKHLERSTYLIISIHKMNEIFKRIYYWYNPISLVLFNTQLPLKKAPTSSKVKSSSPRSIFWNTQIDIISIWLSLHQELLSISFISTSHIRL